MADNGPNPRQLGKYIAISQVGFEMVVPIGLGVWLDNVFGSTPWLTIVGVLVGLTTGLYHVVVLSSQKNDDGPPGGGPPGGKRP